MIKLIVKLFLVFKGTSINSIKLRWQGPLYDGRPKKRPLLRILRLRHLCIPAQHSLHEVNEHFEDAQIYKGNAASAALANL